MPKLNHAVRLLSQKRPYTPKFVLRTIYYCLFNSHLIYAWQTWRKSKTEIFNKIQKLQHKALRIINLQTFYQIQPRLMKFVRPKKF